MEVEKARCRHSWCDVRIPAVSHQANFHFQTSIKWSSFPWSQWLYIIWCEEELSNLTFPNGGGFCEISIVVHVLMLWDGAITRNIWFSVMCFISWAQTDALCYLSCMKQNSNSCLICSISSGSKVVKTDWACSIHQRN